MFVTYWEIAVCFFFAGMSGKGIPVDNKYYDYVIHYPIIQRRVLHSDWETYHDFDKAPLLLHDLQQQPVHSVIVYRLVWGHFVATI